MFCGSLVKGLRRRPLTAETGVRFPYELFKKQLEIIFSCFFVFRIVCTLIIISYSIYKKKMGVTVLTILY